MLTYHRKYLGFWYIALDTVTNSSSNFSGSSRFIGTCTKSFDTKITIFGRRELVTRYHPTEPPPPPPGMLRGLNPSVG